MAEMMGTAEVVSSLRPAIVPTFRTEVEFQAAVVKLARGAGFLAYHTFDSRRSQAGFPDLLLVHPWRKLVIVAELKVGTNKCTPAQTAWLEAFRAVGIEAHEWRPEMWHEIEARLRGVIG